MDNKWLLSPVLPIETARAIREKQKGKKVLEYDPEKTAQELRKALQTEGIQQFQIE